jgi:hypothetical protein
MAVIERRAQKNGHTKASLIRAEFQQNIQRKYTSSIVEPSSNNLFQRGKSMNSAKGIGLPPVLKNNQFIDEAIKKIMNSNNMTQSRTTTHFAKVNDSQAIPSQVANSFSNDVLIEIRKGN